MTAAERLLAAAGLPARWHSGSGFVLLDTDFRGGERFVTCWRLWRDFVRLSAGAKTTEGANADPAYRQLHVVAMLPRMLDVEAVRGLLAASNVCPSAPELTQALLDAWPPATPDLHRLAFDGGSVQLLLVSGELRERLPQLEAMVDAILVDAAALTHNADAQWPLRFFKALGRLATPGATLVVADPLQGPVDAAALRSALRTAGFSLPVAVPDADPAACWCAHREAASTRGAPPHRDVGRGFGRNSGSERRERHALIVGAGLAGCATAWALAELGWRSTVVDRHDAPACEASGNPAGLFHGIVNPQDGAHARFNRAAALEAQRAVRIAIEQHGVPGAVGGLLRLDTERPDDADALAAMRAVLQRLALPPDYVQALSASEASALAGIRLSHPCWYYPGGGWVQPAGLARAFLRRGGERVRFEGGVAGVSLRRAESNGNRPARWQLLDADHQVLAESAVVVLATAGAVAPWLAIEARLEGSHGDALLHSPCTALKRVRGQLSWLPAEDVGRQLPGLVLPRLPVAGSGYLLPLAGGCAVFGATSQTGDEDSAVRGSDHGFNIMALGRLTGLHVDTFAAAAYHLSAGTELLQGRTAWRCVADDKLPLIGAVPDETGWASRGDAASRNGQPQGRAGRQITELRRVPRLPGLYTFSALGSRGITWAALGAQVLAATISGAPVPLAAGLLDAIDPARFSLRSRRRP